MRNLIVFFAAAACLYGQGRNYGRSMVIAQQGIAATSQTLASQAARADSGEGRLGGGCGHRRQRRARRGRADEDRPRRRSVRPVLGSEHRQAHRAERLRTGAQGSLAGVPRASRASRRCRATGFTASPCRARWMAGRKMHQRYGKLPWKDLFQAAIAYAEQGFPVTEAIQESWAASSGAHSKNIRNRCACFCPAARSRRVATCSGIRISGTRLRLIAEQGPAAFYKGEIAAAILEDLAASWAAR